MVLRNLINISATGNILLTITFSTPHSYKPNTCIYIFYSSTNYRNMENVVLQLVKVPQSSNSAILQPETVTQQIGLYKSQSSQTIFLHTSYKVRTYPKLLRKSGNRKYGAGSEFVERNGCSSTRTQYTIS